MATPKTGNKRTGSREESPALPVPKSPKEACDFFIRTAMETLRDLGFDLDQGEFYGESKADSKAGCYLSSRGPREKREQQYRTCVPRLYLRPKKDEEDVIQVQIILDNTQACHPGMIGALKKIERTWEISFREMESDTRDRSTEAIYNSASRLAPIVLIHYLRVRQTCVECMLESDRLRREAEQFAATAVVEAMHN